MADEDLAYVARLEFRKDASYYDTQEIVVALEEEGYRTEHSVTNGSLQVRREEY